jgi:hypothetical protein
MVRDRTSLSVGTAENRIWDKVTNGKDAACAFIISSVAKIWI